MEYLLLIHSETARNAEAVPVAARNQMLAAYTAYTQALQQAGILKSSNRLRPAASANSSSSVRGCGKSGLFRMQASAWSSS